MTFISYFITVDIILIRTSQNQNLKSIVFILNDELTFSKDKDK